MPQKSSFIPISGSSISPLTAGLNRRRPSAGSLRPSLEEVRWIRKAGLDLVVNAKREIAPEDVAHIANNISRTPELVMLKETKVAGLRGTTSLSDNRFPVLWEESLRLHKDLLIAAGAGYCICETQQTAYAKAEYKAFLNRRNCERSLKSSSLPFFVAGDDFPSMAFHNLSDIVEAVSMPGFPFRRPAAPEHLDKLRVGQGTEKEKKKGDDAIDREHNICHGDFLSSKSQAGNQTNAN